MDTMTYIIVTGPVRNRQDKLVRTKTYYFDTETGLLMHTRYYDQSANPPVEMETHYSVWGEINGSRYPARVDHFRNGQRQFTFIAEEIVKSEINDSFYNEEIPQERKI